MMKLSTRGKVVLGAATIGALLALYTYDQRRRVKVKKEKQRIARLAHIRQALAARRIQKAGKGYNARRWERKRSAAIRLQCLVRLQQARAVLRQRRANRSAAVRLQCAVRARLARAVLVQRRMKYRAATAVQSLVRRQQARGVLRQLQVNRRAAIRIQCAVRSCVARAVLEQRRVWYRAATTLQCLVRVRRSRIVLSQHKLHKSAAIVLQSLARMQQARIILNQHKSNRRAAITVQCAVSSHLARAVLTRIRLEYGAAVVLQCAFRAHQARGILRQKKVEYKASRTIQCVARRRTARALLQQCKLRRSAATVIQCSVRLYLAKAALERSRVEYRAATFIQCLARKRHAFALLQQHKVNKSAATVVQCAVRMYMARTVRNRRRVEYRAARTVQCLVRKQKARAIVHQRKLKRSAAIVLQCAARVHIAGAVLNRMRVECGAACILQRVARRRLACAIVRKLKVDRSAAARIQCWWRRCVARALLERKSVEYNAATSLQCLVRRRRARIVLHQHKQYRRAATTIQQYIRAHQARAVLEKKRLEYVAVQKHKAHRIACIRIQCATRVYLAKAATTRLRSQYRGALTSPTNVDAHGEMNLSKAELGLLNEEDGQSLQMSPLSMDNMMDWGELSPSVMDILDSTQGLDAMGTVDTSAESTSTLVPPIGFFGNNHLSNSPPHHNQTFPYFPEYAASLHTTECGNENTYSGFSGASTAGEILGGERKRRIEDNEISMDEPMTPAIVETPTSIAFSIGALSTAKTTTSNRRQRSKASAHKPAVMQVTPNASPAPLLFHQSAAFTFPLIPSINSSQQSSSLQPNMLPYFPDHDGTLNYHDAECGSKDESSVLMDVTAVADAVDSGETSMDIQVPPDMIQEVEPPQFPSFSMGASVTANTKSAEKRQGGRATARKPAGLLNVQKASPSSPSTDSEATSATSSPITAPFSSAGGTLQQSQPPHQYAIFSHFPAQVAPFVQHETDGEDKTGSGGNFGAAAEAKEACAESSQEEENESESESGSEKNEHSEASEGEENEEEESEDESENEEKEEDLAFGVMTEDEATVKAQEIVKIGYSPEIYREDVTDVDDKDDVYRYLLKKAFTAAKKCGGKIFMTYVRDIHKNLEIYIAFGSTVSIEFFEDSL